MLLIDEGGGNVPNAELKSRIRKEGLYMWQVASMIPISDSNFSKWMRIKMDREKMEKINSAIEEAKKMYL